MDDLISRQAAITLPFTSKEDREYQTHNLDDAYELGWLDYQKCIENLPSAERRGRWEDVEHAPNGLLYVTCSVCGKRQTVETANYCGNCGSFNGEGEENAELQR